VIYRGIQYSVVATADADIWEWRYEMGAQVKSGKTQTRLAALAARRVRSKIDAALRSARPPERASHERAEPAQSASHHQVA
jgi:hypothetical protein